MDQAEKFRAFVAGYGGGAAVARELNVTRAAVSAWSLGRMAPRRPLRLAIEALSKGSVPAEGWFRPRKKHERRKPKVEKIAATVPADGDDYFPAG
jgi:hypothetical protein